MVDRRVRKGLTGNRRGRPAGCAAARVVALVLLASAVVPLLAGVAPAAQQERDAEQVRADLERLRAQIAALEGQLADMGERRVSLIDEFEAADVELALSRQRLELIRLRLDVIAEQSAERASEVDRLSGELDVARTELAERAVALYRMGPLSYARFLLAADSADEILSSYQIVGRLAEQDRALVASIRTRLSEHRDAVELMEASRERIAATRIDESAAVDDLATRQAARRELIRQIDIDSAAGRQALADQQEGAGALEDLLATITAPSAGSTTGAGDTAASAAGPGAAATTFADARGSLAWPAEGPITQTFGRKKHPIYDTYTLSKGIEIDAGAGSSVHAVYEGRVVFADWFQSYGLVVIVDHGAEFFSIYGHLEVVRVRAGDRVEGGAEVGTVGETGSLIGPSLYFEIREGADAINPEAWLRRR